MLASSAVAELISTSCIDVILLGMFRLRNVRDPIQIFSIECEGAVTTSVIDPVCRMRVNPDHAPGRLRHEGVDFCFCSLACAALFAASPESYN